MRVGLTYNMRDAMLAELIARGLPVLEDALEEYDSRETVHALAAAIEKAGHEVLLFGWGRDALGAIFTRSPDIVFNIAEGIGPRAREAQMPAALDMLGVPYVGSDPMALVLAQDKALAKQAVRVIGVEVPRGFVARSGIEALGELHVRQIPYPLIVKPSYEGSSRGIRNNSVVREDQHLQAQVEATVREYQQPALIEELIQGQEITVGIVGDPPRVLGVMELAQKEPWEIYSLEVKRRWRETVEFIVPARLTEYTKMLTEKAALRAFNAVGCQDMARVDFRVRDGVPVFLEINPLPGLNPESDLPILARPLSYDQVVQSILSGAIQRHGLKNGS